MGAAVCVAVGSALQHHAATMAGGYHGGIVLLWRLVRSRRWMAGLAVLAAGTVLHAAALRVGAVAVVEAVMVTNLALALPARVLLDRVRPSSRLVMVAIALSGGIAVFVVAAHPGTGQPDPDGRASALVIVVGAAVATLSMVAVARVRSARVAGLALGLAAGILYGLAGGVLKAVVHAVPLGLAAAVCGWPLWTLAVLGSWAFIVHQRAYARAPLQASLPTLSAASPLAGLAFGTLAFGEQPAHGPASVLGEVLGLAVIIVSVALLGRLSRPGRESPDST
jgi:hypothetical protein